jgi:uncharacterized MAPEG superfamily protein
VPVLLCAWPGVAASSPGSDPAVALQLEVFIDGQATGLIAGFLQFPDSRIAAKRSELTAIGIKSPEGPPGEIVRLSDISGIQYRYDSVHQTIDIVARDTQRVPRVLNARSEIPFHDPERTLGAYLNYSVFFSGDYNSKSSIEFDGASLSLDGNLFGPFGTLAQTAILTADAFKSANVLRLDSSWTYSDPRSIMSYRAGDLISGGLSWTRPIRVGGVQVQRDFSLRPDLMTMPLPSFAGSVAVPSTLDVYVGDAKAYSTQVPSGPFLLDNIPIISSCVLCLIQVVVASHAASLQRGYRWTASSRDAAAPPLTGVAGRLERALRNFLETFPVFVSAIFLVHILGRESALSSWGAGLYFSARLIYLPLYAAGVPLVRSLVWNVALVGIVLLLLASVWPEL